MRIQDTRVTYGSQITPHVWQDTNGQLIIRDAVLARCGSYDYLESEIVPGGSSQKIVKVYRDEKEVFDPVSIASFENKPFCNDHPEDDVCPENVRDLQVGFIRDIRRGTGEFENCLIGDIIVTDPTVIELITSSKKRELSLGYNTQIVKGEDGQYYMTKIRGNHLALVDSGRAGNATIRDNNTVNNKKGDERMARKIIYKTLNRDKFINQLYDEDVVKIEELEDDDEVIENLPEDAGEEMVVEEMTDPAEQPVGSDDLNAQIGEIKAMLQQILDLVAAPKAEVPVETQDEELPVEEEQQLPEQPVEQVDEDITADEHEEEEPTLFDAGEEVEEAAEDLAQAIEEEEDEEDEEEEMVQDSAANLYSSLVGVADHNVNNPADDINKSFMERYKKIGGKN